jgi:nicotinamidase-related amidase
MNGLLILDIQNDFTGPQARFPVDANQAAEIIANINKLTANLQSNGLIPVYIGNEFSKYDLLNIFRNFAAIKGSDGCKIDKRLNIVNNNYFPKNRSNAFVNRDLSLFLEKNKIDELFIAGLFAEACVWATVKSAVKKGYKTTILSDCIATSTDKKRKAVIEKYKRAGVGVLSGDTLNRGN